MSPRWTNTRRALRPCSAAPETTSSATVLSDCAVATAVIRLIPIGRRRPIIERQIWTRRPRTSDHSFAPGQRPGPHTQSAVHHCAAPSRVHARLLLLSDDVVGGNNRTRNRTIYSRIYDSASATDIAETATGNMSVWEMTSTRRGWLAADFRLRKYSYLLTYLLTFQIAKQDNKMKCINNRTSSVFC